MICPICQSKLKNEKNFIKHLEEKHKEEGDCGCDKGGSGCSGGGTSGIKFEKTIERARKRWKTRRNLWIWMRWNLAWKWRRKNWIKSRRILGIRWRVCCWRINIYVGLSTEIIGRYRLWRNRWNYALCKLEGSGSI